MATINYAFKEVSCKIVYYGAGLCGKTTNLLKIHDLVPAKHRGEMVSVATEQDRTLFFDFLPIDLGEVKGYRTKFQIYTVPGQVFYNATRKLVLRGADGVVFVADSAADKMEENLESWHNLIDNLAETERTIDQIPIFIQYNKRDLPNALPIEELQAQLNHHNMPWIEAIAIDGLNVSETLKRISSLVLLKIRAAMDQRMADSLATPRKAPPAVAAMSEASSAPSSSPSPSHSPQRGADASRRRTSGATLSRFGSLSPAKLDFSFPVRQQCDVFWKRRRLGSAFVEFDHAPGGGTVSADVAEFKVKCSIKMLVLFNKKIDSKLRYFGSEIRNSRIGEYSYSTFCPVRSASKSEKHLFAWVRNGRIPKFYLRCHGMLGEYILIPEGDGIEF